MRRASWNPVVGAIQNIICVSIAQRNLDASIMMAGFVVLRTMTVIALCRADRLGRVIAIFAVLQRLNPSVLQYQVSVLAIPDHQEAHDAATSTFSVRDKNIYTNVQEE